LARHGEFLQGDLEGIWTQGFILNSSRLLNDFRKIQYTWLDLLPRNMIDSWQDLNEIFAGNIQGMYV
jgi:hypothetical protein